MKIKNTKIYKNMEALFKYQEFKIFADYLGLHFYDENDNEVFFINDYFDATDGKIFNDHFLLLRNSKYGFRIYDLLKKEIVSSLRLTDDKMASNVGYQIIGDKLYVIAGSSGGKYGNFFSQDEDDEEVNHSIDIYSLPSLEKIDEIITTNCFYSIDYIPLYDTIYLIEEDNSLYSLKDKEIKHVDRFQFEVFGIICNMERKEVYLVTHYGIRVYDYKFNEINKFDFISDQPMDFKHSKFKNLPFELTESLKKTTRDSVLSMDILSKDYIFALISQDISKIYEIAIFSLKNGEKVYSLEIPNPIECVEVIDENNFWFILRRNLHCMEIEYDK